MKKLHLDHKEDCKNFKNTISCVGAVKITLRHQDVVVLLLTKFVEQPIIIRKYQSKEKQRLRFRARRTLHIVSTQ